MYSDTPNYTLPCYNQINKINRTAKMIKIVQMVLMIQLHWANILCKLNLSSYLCKASFQCNGTVGQMTAIAVPHYKHVSRYKVMPCILMRKTILLTIKHWMSQKVLMLNSDQTEVMLMTFTSNCFLCCHNLKPQRLKSMQFTSTERSKQDLGKHSFKCNAIV